MGNFNPPRVVIEVEDEVHVSRNCTDDQTCPIVEPIEETDIIVDPIIVLDDDPCYEPDECVVNSEPEVQNYEPEVVSLEPDIRPYDPEMQPYPTSSDRPYVVDNSVGMYAYSDNTRPYPQTSVVQQIPGQLYYQIDQPEVVNIGPNPMRIDQWGYDPNFTYDDQDGIPPYIEEGSSYTTYLGPY